jgi:hypothetical protein
MAAAEEWTATFEAFDPINGPDSNVCGLVQEAAAYFPSIIEEEELAMRLAIAYGKAAGERRFNTCCGIRVSSGEPCQFAVTKTGCGVKYCNQHKVRASRGHRQWRSLFCDLRCVR